MNMIANKAISEMARVNKQRNRYNLRNRMFAGLALVASLASHAGAVTLSSEATPPKPGQSQMVASINNVPITRAQIDEAVTATQQADTPALRDAITEQLVMREVLRQAAEKEGVDKRPEVQREIQAARVTIESDAYLKSKVPKSSLTDAQVKAKYDELISALGTSEFKMSGILVSDEAAAKKVTERLKTGGDFAALAREVSIDGNKEMGGELPWVSFKTPVEEGKTQGYPFAVADAVSKLNVGAVSKPIKISAGFLVIKLDEKRPVAIADFDQIKEGLRQKLEAAEYQKALMEYVARLVKESAIHQ